jgi:hypothetical protein
MDKRVPSRTCLGCGAVKDKKDLVRIVFETDIDNETDCKLCLDETGKMKGRGAYLCRCSACLDKALKKKAFNRAYRMPVPEGTIIDLKDRFVKLQEAYETR